MVCNMSSETSAFSHTRTRQTPVQWFNFEGSVLGCITFIIIVSGREGTVIIIIIIIIVSGKKEPNENRKM